MTEIDPIRDAVVTARRRQILEAAVVVFAEKGYHRATIKDIARHAGVADGTIYNYFKNKQDIMLSVVYQLTEINELIDQIGEAAVSLPPAEILEMVFKNRLRVLRKNLPLLRAIFPQIVTDPDLKTLFWDKLLQPNLEKGEEIFAKALPAEGDTSADPKMIIRGVLSVIFGTIMLAIMGDTIILNNSDSFSDQMTAIFLRGLNFDQPETGA